MKKAKTAGEIMQTGIVTVAANDPLQSIQRLFYEEGIHGAPVVDGYGQVQGIITSSDILRAAVEDRELARDDSTPIGGALEYSRGAWEMDSEEFIERLGDAVASDYMTQEIVEVRPDTPISEVARLIREHQIHRVLVVESGKLCGLVSTFDLVSLLEE